MVGILNHTFSALCRLRVHNIQVNMAYLQVGAAFTLFHLLGATKESGGHWLALHPDSQNRRQLTWHCPSRPDTVLEQRTSSLLLEDILFFWIPFA